MAINHHYSQFSERSPDGTNGTVTQTGINVYKRSSFLDNVDNQNHRPQSLTGYQPSHAGSLTQPGVKSVPRPGLPQGCQPHKQNFLSFLI